MVVIDKIGKLVEVEGDSVKNFDTKSGYRVATAG